MKKLWSYLKGWRGISLTVYMWMILMSWVIVYININRSKHYIFYISEFILITLMFICPHLISWAERQGIIPDSDMVTRFDEMTFFLKSWFAVFIVFFAMYIIFYPGGFSPDSISQYRQAAGIERYSDWHPVLHTLFAFTLPLKLSGGWIGSIVLFQIMLASLAIAYMILTLAKYGNRKYAIIILIYTLINPLTLGIIMYPWKDVTFSIFAMLSMTYAVKIYFSGGKWLCTWKNIVMFVLSVSSATLFRHNAVLFTLPLLFTVLFYADRKRKIILIISCCVFVLMIRNILYPSLGAAKPGYRIVETTLAPMTVIANAVYESPEKIDTEVKDFLYSVVSEDKLEENYITGSFNSVKFKGINGNAIEEAGYRKIFRMMFRCFREAPFESLRGFAALTDMVYGI